MRRRFWPLVPFRRRIQRRLRARRLAHEMLRCLLLGGGARRTLLPASARPPSPSLPLLSQLGLTLLRTSRPRPPTGATTLPH